MSLAPLPTLTGDVVVSASGVSVSSTAASVPPPTSVNHLLTLHLTQASPLFVISSLTGVISIHESRSSGGSGEDDRLWLSNEEEEDAIVVREGGEQGGGGGGCDGGVERRMRIAMVKKEEE
ncbi:hypothetical protein F2Q69_00035159 [Brassica cretica]|uniref:Uncharacterized protein n=2 Tax=Brassica cretica TaxID=69181 RepID=A0A8S9SNV3_BRACR|nr:hypothetical protein DY000_02039735 [Brassica cretica]KAF3603431.1 hypothetical protein F2Q69_00035159 [Brassica cretica]